MITSVKWKLYQTDKFNFCLSNALYKQMFQLPACIAHCRIHFCGNIENTDYGQKWLRLRYYCFIVTESKIFEYFILFVIFASSITLVSSAFCNKRNHCVFITNNSRYNIVLFATNCSNRPYADIKTNFIEILTNP